MLFRSRDLRTVGEASVGTAAHSLQAHVPGRELEVQEPVERAGAPEGTRVAGDDQPPSLHLAQVVEALIGDGTAVRAGPGPVARRELGQARAEIIATVREGHKVVDVQEWSRQVEIVSEP